jgi:molybdopterin-synthase adenylyltransferase
VTANTRFSRNEALFGREGQARIGRTKVLICGLGGLGSHVAQQLAYLGVHESALVDYDVVTDSSLNRLVGASDADALAGTKKVAIAQRVVQSINPSASITLVDGRVGDREVELLLSDADVVFGCLDRDIHRLELTDLCSRYAKPYFDVASDTGGERSGLWYGGRVVFCNGNRCLVCLQLLDQVAIAHDRMSPEQRDAERRLYGVDSRELGSFGPAVVSVNGVVASLAVTEFMALVTGLRQPAGQLIYRGDLSIVTKSFDEPERDCYYCVGIWGQACHV